MSPPRDLTVAATLDTYARLIALALLLSRRRETFPQTDRAFESRTARNQAGARRNADGRAK